ncbi:hypothetical protein JW835_05840 [bacterium]|nr:hypothetical protein [bacterium]
MKKIIFLVIVLHLFIALLKCGGGVKYLKPNEESPINTSGISETDIKIMCNDILEKIKSSDLIRGNSIQPAIAILKITNETSEYINTNALIEENIIIPLKRGNFIRLIERKYLKKILEEKVLGQAGFTGKGNEIENYSLIGVDYYVKGELNSLEKTSFSKEYILYTLSLQFLSVSNSEIEYIFRTELRKLRKKGFFNE